MLYPLEKAGYVSLECGTREKDCGAKPFLVAPTDKSTAELITPLIEQIEQQTQAGLRPMLRKPLNEIREELIAPDKHVRGLALESLTFKLMRLIDLNYVATRLRGSGRYFRRGAARFFKMASAVQEHGPRIARRRG